MRHTDNINIYVSLGQLTITQQRSRQLSLQDKMHFIAD